jgi:hypothetical protein
MKSRVASLFLGAALVSTPVFAQGPPAGGSANGALQKLASDLAALTQRVDKLEGNIVAADLAGTYSVVGLSTTMTAFRAGTPPVPATINTSAFRATVTLNADGTGAVSDTTCEGSTLTQGTWAMQGFDCGEPGSGLTWTYADGVITITFLNDNEETPFNVAIGGRLLVNAYAPFHPSDPSSDQFVIVATRLR